MVITPITGLDVTGKRLVVRADLNVPLQDGKVSDATRIERFATGMKPLLQKGARLVVLSHLGRPNGERNQALSLSQIVPALSKALGTGVIFSGTCTGPEAELKSASLANCGVLLCENLRFGPGEEKNDPALAARLAKLGDIYVNDAFSTAHRAHASTAAIADIMPATAGPLMLEEIAALTRALEAPKRPSVAIVGGAKISSKIAVLKNLVHKLDAIIIGGGMANTFLYAEGLPIGKSLCEPDQIETVYEIKKLAQAAGCSIVLPSDIVYARKFEAGARFAVADVDGCPDDAMILDAGPDSVRRFQSVISDSETILWNGPLGAFEISPFDQATRVLATTAAELTRSGLATTIAGGGDTIAALNMAGVTQDFTYVSTAGGAFLEWLEGKTLPGIAALTRTEAA